MDKFVIRRGQPSPSQSSTEKSSIVQDQTVNQTHRSAQKRARLDELGNYVPVADDQKINIVDEKHDTSLSEECHDSAGSHTFGVLGLSLESESASMLPEAVTEADAIATGLATRSPTRITSSIYVDALNMVLETISVESDLFDTNEKQVVQRWLSESFDAQYLYVMVRYVVINNSLMIHVASDVATDRFVRLYLRKSRDWLRLNKLNYMSDGKALEKAVVKLHKSLGFTAQLPSDSCVHLDSTCIRMLEICDQVSVKEGVKLVNMDELKTLAKNCGVSVQGKNKRQLQNTFCDVRAVQTELQKCSGNMSTNMTSAQKALIRREDQLHSVVGRCVCVNPYVRQVFDRALLIFNRSTEWTERSILTTVILSKIARWNFPKYTIERLPDIFSSRDQVVEFESALRCAAEVDLLLDGGPAHRQISNSDDVQSELSQHDRYKRVVVLGEDVYARWQQLMAHEKDQPFIVKYGGGVVLATAENGQPEDASLLYMRRFRAAHPLTRVIHKMAFAHGKLKNWQREHELLTELLTQRMFHPGRRGMWYTRKALIEERYMADIVPIPSSVSSRLGSRANRLQQRRNEEEAKARWLKHWRLQAKVTCESGLQDKECHVIYHDELQKRLVRLERLLRIPKREQHCFDHVRLAKAEDLVLSAIQVKKKGNARADDPFTAMTTNDARSSRSAAPTRTMWLCESALLGTARALDSSVAEAARPAPPSTSGQPDKKEVQDNGPWSAMDTTTVEQLVLSFFATQGFKGYHSESRIIHTIFAYLFFDILFANVPYVFQTPYQTHPLDLFTDGFYLSRRTIIEQRLAEISNGAAPQIMRDVYSQLMAADSSEAVNGNPTSLPEIGVREEDKSDGIPVKPSSTKEKAKTSWYRDEDTDLGASTDTNTEQKSSSDEIEGILIEISSVRRTPNTQNRSRIQVIGLNWNFAIDDLLDLVHCWDGGQLAAVCHVLTQEYRFRGGGVPDLIVWKPRISAQLEPVEPTGSSSAVTSFQPSDSGDGPSNGRGQVMFVEVKSTNDRLSETQKVWIDVLVNAGVKVVVARVTARDVRYVEQVK